MGGDLKKLFSKDTQKQNQSNRLKDIPRDDLPIKVGAFYDMKGWAWWHRTNNVAKHIAKDIEITPIQIGDEFNPDEYDFLLVLDYYVPDRLPSLPTKKVILGCSSPRNLSQALEVFKRNNFLAFVVNNKEMYDMCNGLTNLFCCQNGVDSEFFTPRAEAMTEVVACWIGNTDSVGEKGLGLIQAACRLLGVQLNFLDRAGNNTVYSHELLREKLYGKSSVYINASQWEGTPNPALEAMACGLPVISTRTGNMPELIVEGQNGFIVDRSVEGIATALIRLKHADMAKLSANARKSIEDGWTWKDQAKKYEHMFRVLAKRVGHRSSKSVSLILHDSDRQTNTLNNDNQLFLKRSDVYLASADRMNLTLENCATLNQTNRCVFRYASVIGGLSGLNYIPFLHPEKILFFDINPEMIPYCKLIIELIAICDTPEDFISRVFSRSMNTFHKNYGSKLSTKNQEAFLALPVDLSILEETLLRLSTAARAVYSLHIGPHLDGQIVPGTKNCRRLLPCWPINERVPVGGGKDQGYDERGVLVPNTNTFFYGHGWLGSPALYSTLQDNLAKTKIEFKVVNLLEERLENLITPGRSFAIHTSNIDEWFADDWRKILPNWQKAARKHASDLVVITSHSGVGHVQPDPHCLAYEAVLPYVYGKVIEVTHKPNWGFHEFEREVVVANDYIAASSVADTVIVHILVGEGLSSDILKQVCRQALSRSKRVIVLEHDRDSKDWENTETSLLNKTELLTLLEPLSIETDSDVVNVVSIPGIQSNKRNVAVVLDSKKNNDNFLTLPYISHIPSVPIHTKTKNVKLYKTYRGDLYWLDRRKYLDQMIITKGFFEERSTALTRCFVRPNNVVLDIGANIGYYSVLFSKIVGPKGKVHCFEPFSDYRKVLIDNIVANKLQNIAVYDFGLSDQASTRQIFKGECSATMHWVADFEPFDIEDIHLQRLDDIAISILNLERLDFIKIDVDGHEARFLYGAMDTIRKHRPLILLEVSMNNYEKAGISMDAFFRQIKKDFYVYDEHSLMELESYNHFYERCCFDKHSVNILLSFNKFTATKSNDNVLTFIDKSEYLSTLNEKSNT